MNRLLLSVPLSLLFAGHAEAYADSMTYTNPGTVAAQSTFYAVSTGEVVGYFVVGGAASGGGAGDTDYMYLYNVTTNTRSQAVFNSQTTNAGATASFGFVNQGDQLVFGLYDSTTGSTGASWAQYSSDGLNHAYAVNYAGGTLNGASMPAGVYFGMEDRMVGQQYADFNYNDEDFVVTNVAIAPEPSSLMLLSTGILGAARLLRRRA